MNKLLLIGLVALLPGCVSEKKYRRAIDDAAEVCKQTVAMVETGYLKELGEKNDRLRKFNQLNNDGTLR